MLRFATDGAFFPDGRHLVLRGYGDATVYTWPDLTAAGTVQLPRQEQGEGIAVREVDGEFEVLVSSEGQRSDVLSVTLPQSLAQAVAPVAPADSAGAGTTPVPSATPSPTVDPDAAPIEGDRVDQGPPLAPWLVGIGFGVVMLVLLVRSLRPR